jgi:hypothetical protein
VLDVLAGILAGNIDSQPNVGLDEGSDSRLVATASRIDKLTLSGSGEDSGVLGEFKVRHMQAPSVVDVAPIYIAGCVPTLDIWEVFLLS